MTRSPLRWQEGTIVDAETLTPRVKGIKLKPDGDFAFIAGQHVDVRLTAPDGYQAQRSYSIASAPVDGSVFELAIELLEGGEVSPFFHEVALPGDRIEFRGPIGGHFNWEAATGGPILLLAGGSGVVPLLSIVRQRETTAPGVPAALLYSARSFDDVIHREELFAREAAEPAFHLHLALTRERREGHHAGRIDAGLLAKALGELGDPPKLVYVCGSNAFVEAANELVLEAGIEGRQVRNERFGGAPVGGG